MIISETHEWCCPYCNQELMPRFMTFKDGPAFLHGLECKPCKKYWHLTTTDNAERKPTGELLGDVIEEEE